MRSEIKQVKFASGGSVTPCMWMEYFMNSGKDVEHEAFLVFWLFRGGFCNVAVHLSRGNRVALASVVLACIFRDTNLLPVSCTGDS